MREPTTREAALFTGLTEVGVPLIREHFGADSCIASTRIGLDVLTHFGVPAKELSLMLAVFNPVAAAMLATSEDMSAVAAAITAAASDDPEGPWSLGVGRSTPGADPTRKWSGHLVVAVPTVGVLIDLTADQASRPLKHIPLSPFWMAGLDEAVFTNPTVQYPVERGDGVLFVVDRASTTDPHGYRRSPNWHRKTFSSAAPFREVTGRIIRALRPLIPTGI